MIRVAHNQCTGSEIGISGVTDYIISALVLHWFRGDVIVLVAKSGIGEKKV